MQPVYVTLISALAIISGGWLTFLASRRKTSADAGQQMIDQHQEDIVEMRREIAALQRQVRVQGDYIGQLRRHIADESPPPPPPWPSALVT